MLVNDAFAALEHETQHECSCPTPHELGFSSMKLSKVRYSVKPLASLDFIQAGYLALIGSWPVEANASGAARPEDTRAPIGEGSLLIYADMQPFISTARTTCFDFPTMRWHC